MRDGKFTQHESALVREILEHDGWKALMELQRHNAARITNALAKESTDWDETNRLRGQLNGMALLMEPHIRNKMTSQSDNP